MDKTEPNNKQIVPPATGIDNKEGKTPLQTIKIFN